MSTAWLVELSGCGLSALAAKLNRTDFGREVVALAVAGTLPEPANDANRDLIVALSDWFSQHPEHGPDVKMSVRFELSHPQVAAILDALRRLSPKTSGQSPSAASARSNKPGRTWTPPQFEPSQRSGANDEQTAAICEPVAARASLDLDIAAHRAEEDRDELLRRFEAAGEMDLGDHFRFEVTSRREHHQGSAQPHVAGHQLTLAAYCGIRNLDSVKIDVVTGSLITGTPQPLTRPSLAIDGIDPVVVTACPIADHIADKGLRHRRNLRQRPQVKHPRPRPHRSGRHRKHPTCGCWGSPPRHQPRMELPQTAGISSV